MFTGEGQLSTECPYCTQYAIYESNEFVPLKAKQKIPAPHQSANRVEPSNMARQPIKRKYPKAEPVFGPGQLEDRPKAAALVARCISLWTDVEIQQAYLLAQILGANTEPAMAMFLAISNSRTQYEVLNAAARIALNEQDYELFSAHMNIRTGLEKERNHLVHGQFGGSRAIKDGVAWVNAIDQSAYSARVRMKGTTPELLQEFLDKVFVYELGDLETIARNFQDFHQNLGLFTGYLSSLEPSWRATRYPQLCAWPPLERELARMREAQKNKTAVPK
jgi:hypothetical protein